MKISVTILSAVLCFFCIQTSAGILLTAKTHTENDGVTLQWNMIDYGGNTGYTLFKSNDGVLWQPSAANHVYRNYTASTLLAYNDKFEGHEKLFYKVKVYDENENIIAISNTEQVINPLNNYSRQPDFSPVTKDAKPLPGNSYSNTWQIYPNPVGEVLNLYYKSLNSIKSVINAVVLNASGKAVVKYRGASNNKHVFIDVSHLHAGIYFIRISVFNELQFNEKFIKQ